MYQVTFLNLIYNPINQEKMKTEEKTAVTKEEAAKLLGIKLPDLKPIEPVNGQWLHVVYVLGKKKWEQPEYARFKMKINFSSGSNPKGYSLFYSIDYDNNTKLTNERQGLQDLILLIMYKYHGCFRHATIWANYTTDLNVRSNKYNIEVCHVIGGRPIHEYDRKINGIKFYKDEKGHTRVNLQDSYALLA